MAYPLVYRGDGVLQPMTSAEFKDFANVVLETFAANNGPGSIYIDTPVGVCTYIGSFYDLSFSSNVGNTVPGANTYVAASGAYESPSILYDVSTPFTTQYEGITLFELDPYLGDQLFTAVESGTVYTLAYDVGTYSSYTIIQSFDSGAFTGTFTRNLTYTQDVNYTRYFEGLFTGSFTRTYARDFQGYTADVDQAGLLFTGPPGSTVYTGRVYSTALTFYSGPAIYTREAAITGSYVITYTGEDEYETSLEYTAEANEPVIYTIDYDSISSFTQTFSGSVYSGTIKYSGLLETTYSLTEYTSFEIYTGLTAFDSFYTTDTVFYDSTNIRSESYGGINTFYTVSYISSVYYNISYSTYTGDYTQFMQYEDSYVTLYSSIAYEGSNIFVARESAIYSSAPGAYSGNYIGSAYQTRYTILEAYLGAFGTTDVFFTVNAEYDSFPIYYAIGYTLEYTFPHPNATPGLSFSVTYTADPGYYSNPDLEYAGTYIARRIYTATDPDGAIRSIPDQYTTNTLYTREFTSLYENLYTAFPYTAQYILTYSSLSTAPIPSFNLLYTEDVEIQYTLATPYTLSYTLDRFYTLNYEKEGTSQGNVVLSVKDFYQDLNIPTGDEPPYVMYYNDSNNPINLRINELAEDIHSHLINSEGPGSYVLRSEVPLDGIWVNMGTLSDVYNSNQTTNKYLFKKLLSTGTTPTIARPLKHVSDGVFQRITNAEVARIVKKVREKIISTKVGTYVLAPTAPSEGTWVNTGSILDTRPVISSTQDVFYQLDYTKTYTANSMYEGGAVYVTIDYTGDTISTSYSGADSTPADLTGFNAIYTEEARVYQSAAAYTSGGAANFRSYYTETTYSGQTNRNAVIYTGNQYTTTQLYTTVYSGAGGFGPNSFQNFTQIYTTDEVDYLSEAYSVDYLATYDIASGVYEGPSTSVPVGEVGSQIWTTPGTYNWTVPSGVTFVSIVCVGGGGAGDEAAGGGAGGGLAYANKVPVTPGQTYTVTVGAGGATGNGASAAANGGNSNIVIGTFEIRASGGQGGPLVGPVGSYGGHFHFFNTPPDLEVGGGTGGDSPAVTRTEGMGGGGAGGFTGRGGNGNQGTLGTSTGNAVGFGGGGGGGGASGPLSGGLGSNAGNGGVSYAAGSAGGGGGANVFSTLNPPTNGGNGTNSTSSGTKGGNGGWPGGGGGGAYNNGGIFSSGGDGVVRIIWPGDLRLFPNVLVSDSVTVPQTNYTSTNLYDENAFMSSQIYGGTLYGGTVAYDGAAGTFLKDIGRFSVTEEIFAGYTGNFYTSEFTSSYTKIDTGPTAGDYTGELYGQTAPASYIVSYVSDLYTGIFDSVFTGVFTRFPDVATYVRNLTYASQDYISGETVFEANFAEATYEAIFTNTFTGVLKAFTGVYSSDLFSRFPISTFYDSRSSYISNTITGYTVAYIDSYGDTTNYTRTAPVEYDGYTRTYTDIYSGPPSFTSDPLDIYTAFVQFDAIIDTYTGISTYSQNAYDAEFGRPTYFTNLAGYFTGTESTFTTYTAGTVYDGSSLYTLNEYNRSQFFSGTGVVYTGVGSPSTYTGNLYEGAPRYGAGLFVGTELSYTSDTFTAVTAVYTGELYQAGIFSAGTTPSIQNYEGTYTGSDYTQSIYSRTETFTRAGAPFTPFTGFFTGAQTIYTGRYTDLSGYEGYFYPYEGSYVGPGDVQFLALYSVIEPIYSGYTVLYAGFYAGPYPYTNQVNIYDTASYTENFYTSDIFHKSFAGTLVQYTGLPYTLESFYQGASSDYASATLETYTNELSYTRLQDYTSGTSSFGGLVYYTDSTIYTGTYTGESLYTSTTQIFTGPSGDLYTSIVGGNYYTLTYERPALYTRTFTINVAYDKESGTYFNLPSLYFDGAVYTRPMVYTLEFTSLPILYNITGDYTSPSQEFGAEYVSPVLNFDGASFAGPAEDYQTFYARSQIYFDRFAGNFVASLYFQSNYSGELLYDVTYSNYTTINTNFTGATTLFEGQQAYIGLDYFTGPAVFTTIAYVGDYTDTQYVTNDYIAGSEFTTNFTGSPNARTYVGSSYELILVYEQLTYTLNLYDNSTPYDRLGDLYTGEPTYTADVDSNYVGETIPGTYAGRFYLGNQAVYTKDFTALAFAETYGGPQVNFTNVLNFDSQFLINNYVGPGTYEGSYLDSASDFISGGSFYTKSFTGPATTYTGYANLSFFSGYLNVGYQGEYSATYTLSYTAEVYTADYLRTVYFTRIFTGPTTLYNLSYTFIPEYTATYISGEAYYTDFYTSKISLYYTREYQTPYAPNFYTTEGYTRQQYFDGFSQNTTYANINLYAGDVFVSFYTGTYTGGEIVYDQQFAAPPEYYTTSYTLERRYTQSTEYTQELSYNLASAFAGFTSVVAPGPNYFDGLTRTNYTLVLDYNLDTNDYTGYIGEETTYERIFNVFTLAGVIYTGDVDEAPGYGSSIFRGDIYYTGAGDVVYTDEFKYTGNRIEYEAPAANEVVINSGVVSGTEYILWRRVA